MREPVRASRRAFYDFAALFSSPTACYAGGVTLRKAFGLLVLTLAVLTVATCAALVVLRGEVHGLATDLGTALESVRIAKQLRIELLEADLRARPRAGASDPDALWDLEAGRARLERLLAEASANVQTADERQLVAQARERVQAFLNAEDAPSGPAAAAALLATHSTLRSLEDHNLALARSVEGKVQRWDRSAGLLGLGLVGVVVAVAIALLVWAKRHVLAPLLELRAGIGRFADREFSARLLPRGPVEIREVASAFNDMADELQRQRAERFAMLGGVAHDLRNPLSALRLATFRFVPDRPLPPESRVRALVSLIGRQVQRMDRMVGDFLDASRIEAGTLAIQLEQADVCAVAEHVVTLYRGGEPGREILLLLPERPVVTSCDPGRVEQVLSNLVSNALKYSPRDSKVEVSVAVSSDTDEVVLAVVDQGLGLSEADRRRLFRPFSRVGAWRERVPGVGLGLAVASKIVSAHGGRIEIQSTPGAGSRFEVRLPASAGPPIMAPVEARAGAGLDSLR